MNREELPRIRLKVSTTAGINILCTAMRKWKISDWLPHIQEAFRQVREDQAQDQNSKKTFIRALRLKKGDFYIANSQIIGDVFEDNDEVYCEIDFPGQSKKQAKQNKKNKNAEGGTQNDKKGKDNKRSKPQIQDKDQEPQNQVPKSKPRKKVKIYKEKEIQKQIKTVIEDQNVLQNKKEIQKFKESKSEKQKQKQTVSKARQQYVKVDLSKLKSLLIKSEKIQDSPQPKLQSPQIINQNNSQESS